MLDAAEAKRLIAAARGERLGALYLVALLSGLRQGELLALKWGDADWANGALQIVRKLARTKAGGLAFGDLKSRKGRRALPLPPEVMAELRRHREVQRAEREAAGDAWEDHDLIFANERGKPIERQNLMRRDFKPLLAKAGLPDIRFHDLRHSAATLLFAMGVPVKIVQDRLGHASPKMTPDVYGHASRSMQRDAIDKLSAFLTDGEDDGGKLEELEAA